MINDETLRENRNHLFFVYSILSISKGGATKDEIVNKGNTSDVLTNQYIDALIKSDLLDDVKPNYYGTSKKGEEFLRLYKQLGEIAEPVFRQIEKEKNQ